MIVDDERLARNKLRALLEAHAQVEIVGEADGVEEALKVIRREKPDVVFLDIQMPGASGFELLDKVQRSFKTIFVTAFDEHAIRAFEVNALDYLLKPVNPERLALALERLAHNGGEGESARRLLEYDDHIFISVGERSQFIRVSSIKCISAAGVYSEIHTTDNRKILAHKPLSEWEERLPPKRFTRIHRSTIINIEHVEGIEKWFNYSYQVRLRDIKEPFLMSRRYAAKLKDVLT